MKDVVVSYMDCSDFHLKSACAHDNDRVVVSDWRLVISDCDRHDYVGFLLHILIDVNQDVIKMFLASPPY